MSLRGRQFLPKRALNISVLLSFVNSELKAQDFPHRLTRWDPNGFMSRINDSAQVFLLCATKLYQISTQSVWLSPSLE
jgi:hypothetical protein